jgi:hypothetical protein
MSSRTTSGFGLGRKLQALTGLEPDLFREDVEPDLAAIEAECQAVHATPRSVVAVPRRRRPNRQPLPSHLPRIEHRPEPDACAGVNCSLFGTRSANSSISNRSGFSFTGIAAPIRLPGL